MNAIARDSVSGASPRVPSIPWTVRMRGGSGLGDSIYVRIVAEHLVGLGRAVTVCSNYPDLFRDLEVKIEPFGRDRINVLAHYTAGKANPASTQWEDVQRSAGVSDVPLAFTWAPQNSALVAAIAERAAGRPVVLVHAGRQPMARADGFGRALLPEQAAFEQILAALSDCYLVGVGRDRPLYRLPVDEDLNGSTSVADLVDIFQACDGVLAQCSFAVPLAECFGRPLLAVWSRRGLASGNTYIARITPRKILTVHTSRHVVDDETPEVIAEAARYLRAALAGEVLACGS